MLSKDISYIEIHKGIFFKKVTKSSDLDLLVKLLNNIEVLPDEINLSTNDDAIYRIKVYDKNKKLINSFSFIESRVYYNNKWYNLSPEVYKKIKSIYEELNYSKIENILEKEISKRKLNRKDMSIIEALKGTWIYENNESICFDDEFLYQGSKNNYTFRYQVMRTDNSKVSISVYGTKDLFIKDKKLFDLYIEIDPTRTHMKLKKIVHGSSLVYYDNLIYVDVDTDEHGNPVYYNLGSFDSSYFVNDIMNMTNTQ